jgi:hypothetical protein
MPTEKRAKNPCTTEDAAFLRAELARADDRLMPFGAWRGLPVRSLPRPYRSWCLRSLALPPRLRREILDILARPHPWAAGRRPAGPADSRPRHRPVTSLTPRDRKDT